MAMAIRHRLNRRPDQNFNKEHDMNNHLVKVIICLMSVLLSGAGIVFSHDTAVRIACGFFCFFATVALYTCMDELKP